LVDLEGADLALVDLEEVDLELIADPERVDLELVADPERVDLEVPVLADLVPVERNFAQMTRVHSFLVILKL
jgi:hypothetical protein